MIWQAIARLGFAGWLSAVAFGFSAPRAQTETGVQPPQASQEAFQQTLSESPLKPAEAAEPAPFKEGTVPSTESSAQAASGPVQQGAVRPEEYRLQPEDVLHITVYEEPELTTKVRVAGSGEINFPLLGRLHIEGLTVMEIQERITQLLEENYLVNPQVQVFIIAYHSRRVFVAGAVKNPGSYPLPAGKPTTLMEAVTMAGGFSEEASVNNTKIIRIENGKEITVRVKANDIIKKGDKTKDVEVLPNDVVFVPESFF